MEPCICMQAAGAGIQPLINATEWLMNKSGSNKMKLTFRKFDRAASITELTLRLTPECDELLEMSLSQQGSQVEFEFTPAGMDEFRSALATWQEGVSDFSCHPDIDRAKKHRKQTGIAPRDLESTEVWFWSPFMDP